MSVDFPSCSLNLNPDLQAQQRLQMHEEVSQVRQQHQAHCAVSQGRQAHDGACMHQSGMQLWMAMPIVDMALIQCLVVTYTAKLAAVQVRHHAISEHHTEQARNLTAHHSGW
jgi:hypothetical protein